MKTYSYIQQKAAVALMAAWGGLTAAVNLASAQPLQMEVLVSFNGTNGAWPDAGLTLGTDGNFYGTTSFGGDLSLGGGSGAGTVFRLTTNGVMTSLVSFAGTNGRLPEGDLTIGGDGNFYGTTWDGGSSYAGTVFRVTTNGVVINLVSFASTNGSYPSGLTLANDGTFYGTTYEGGSYGQGTVFRVTTNGVLTTLAIFDGTNGANPFAALTLGNDGNFYGTTRYGVVYGNLGNKFYTFGTVFKVTTTGLLTTLVSFAGTNGAEPRAALTLGSDGSFYGTTSGGGAYLGPMGGNSFGTVFRATTNGVLTTLYSFGAITDTFGDPLDGSGPNVLTLGSDGSFYGTTETSVFQMTTNGVLATFGWLYEAFAGLTLGSDGNFYGTTYYGGDYGYGVIYRLRRGASIQSFGMTANGFQVNTLNVGGSGWVVLDSSNDLMTWTPIQTNGTAAAQQFLDPTAVTQPRQFYRVRQR
jgi:uncharacterized repeat protein (TIGR03803 family)